MMKSKRPSPRLPRRDLLHRLGRRLARLSPAQWAVVGPELARRMQDLGMMDLPKFKHLVDAIESALKARKTGKKVVN